MLQLNLLPDIKTEFIKGQKLKRTVMVISILAAGVAVGLVILTASLLAIQKKHLSNLDKNIAKLTSEFESTPNLEEILSVQSQLVSLPELYNGRPAVDRLPGYLDQTTPSIVRLNNLVVDFATSTIEISGTGDTLEAVNNYVDTIKYTTYKAEVESAESLNAFKDVVLSEFGRDDEAATFTIMFVFDPNIFDITQKIQLTVPNLVTTRAQAPSAELFNGLGEGGESQ
jgi:hypothetical protein